MRAHLASLAAACTTAAALVLAGTPASAAPRELGYGCFWVVGGNQGTGSPATASWDAHIPDDLVVPVGASVPLDLTGSTVTYPAEVVDELRRGGFAGEQIDVYGTLDVFVEGNDTPIKVDLTSAVRVPVEGPMTVVVSQKATDEIRTSRAGSATVIAGTFFLNAVIEETFIECSKVGAGSREIATFEVAGAAPTSPTAEPSTTASAVRPGLVQTDTPDDEGTPAVPAALLGAGALTAAALGRRLRRSGTIRRH